MNGLRRSLQYMIGCRYLKKSKCKIWMGWEGNLLWMLGGIQLKGINIKFEWSEKGIFCECLEVNS